MSQLPKHHSSGPLTGVRVLDMTRLLPGPYAGRILVELGADVIKVEEPGVGDPTRTMAPLVDGVGVVFQATNRGKRSLALDLKQTAGREALLRLVATADILLEGFRPGTLARLGLDYAALQARNPRLIICALTGYGQFGPYSQRAGHDLNYLGYAGLLSHLARPAAPPHVPGTQLADVAGGALMAVIGTLAALVGRGVTGRGQVVDVSMLDGSMALAPVLLATLNAGVSEIPPGGEVLSGALPAYNIYETADGQFVALAALEPKFWAEFLRLVGRPDLLGRHAPHDEAEAAATIAELAALFHTRTRAEWLALLAETDACVGPVNTLSEALADPQVRARQAISDQDSLPPLLRAVPLLSDNPPRALNPAPRLGEHTVALLGEAGYNADEIAILLASGVAQDSSAQ